MRCTRASQGTGAGALSAHCWAAMLPLAVVALAAAFAQPQQQPDLVARFDPASLLDGPGGRGARPASRAGAGLLNGGPEFGEQFLDPLRMANYRGSACRTVSSCTAMKAAGAANIQCDVDQNLPLGAQSCTVLPSLRNTSTCAKWPGTGGNWTPYDTMVTQIVKSRLGSPCHGSWGVSNEPNDAFWPGCKSGCATPDPAWLEVWNRTVRLIRAADTTATIVGPSINTFSLEFLQPFVDYAVANGVMPTVLDWHELSAASNGSEIPQHHDEMRQWLRQHHPSYATIPIGHGETVPSTARLWAGATLGALAGLERAGAHFGVHSNWGEAAPGWEPTGHYKQCGFEELLTCNDQPPAGNDSTRQPRATYHVYAAYGNTSGMMAPVSRHCADADAFASYDDGRDAMRTSSGTEKAQQQNENGQAWLAVGRYSFANSTAPNRSVHVQLSGLPAALVLVSDDRHDDDDGQQQQQQQAASTVVEVELAMIPNRLQLAVPHPVPMGTRLYNVTRSTSTSSSASAAAVVGFDLHLHLPIGPHDVWTVRVQRPK